MPLTLVNDGLLFNLNLLRAAWAGKVKIGLYQNDWTPSRTSTIGEVVPADFTGYVGSAIVWSWSPATLFGDTAQIAGPAILFEATGGETQNWIYGYFAQSLAGVLLWAERDPDGPRAVFGPGNFVSVTPRYSERSTF